MFRKLRVLAAFFMVPLVLFSNPSSAAAAFGPWVTINFNVPAAPLVGDSAPGTIDTVDCVFSMQHQGGFSLGIGTGYCVGLPDVTAGYLQDGEAGSDYRISVSGIGGCSGSMTSTLAPHSANGTMRVAGTITPGDMGVSPEDCSITEVCLQLHSGREDCTTANIAPPVEEPEPTGACPYGTPTVIVHPASVYVHSEGSSAYNWRMHVDFVIQGETPPGVQWTFAPYYDPTSGTDLVSRSSMVVDRALPGATVEISLGDTKSVLKTSPKPDPWLRGVEISATVLDPVTNTTWNQRPSGTAPDTKAQIRATTLPPLLSSNYGGWTDQPHCRFWIGPKQFDVADTEGDEPSSQLGDGLTEPPEPEPVIEPPVVIDEPVDEESWLGAIWALLRSIWGAITSGFSAVVNAVKGIASAILTGMETMFTSLFVPEDDYLTNEFDGMHAQWNNTSPARYLDAVTGFNAGAVSGCGGLPLDVTLPGGVEVHQSIGEACSGSMASAASVTRNVLSAVVMISGGMACVRALGSGLGWNPGVGRESGA